MKIILNRTGCYAFFLIIVLLAAPLFADNHKEKHAHGDCGKSRGHHHDIQGLATVSNTVYADKCGACHLAYQPGLLPSGSWQKIIETLPDHFGEDVALDSGATDDIGRYLVANSAENSSAKLSAKIMKSLKGVTPLRITEVSYIRKKHHEILTQLIERRSVRSISNCSSCHQTADKGEYDDERVSIPE